MNDFNAGLINMLKIASALGRATLSLLDKSHPEYAKLTLEVEECEASLRELETKNEKAA